MSRQTKSDIIVAVVGVLWTLILIGASVGPLLILNSTVQ